MCRKPDVEDPRNGGDNPLMRVADATAWLARLTSWTAGPTAD